MANSNRPQTHSRRWRWGAAAVIVCTGALAAWGAWTRTGASPEQIRQTAETDLRTGRYKQAEAALERIRDLTRATTS